MGLSRRSRIAAGAMLALLGLAIVGFGQGYRGLIRGRLTDPTGQPVAGGSLQLVQEETGQIRTATTDRDGEYRFTLLPPGNYRIEVAQTSPAILLIPLTSVGRRM